MSNETPKSLEFIEVAQEPTEYLQTCETPEVMDSLLDLDDEIDPLPVSYLLISEDINSSITKTHNRLHRRESKRRADFIAAVKYVGYPPKISDAVVASEKAWRDVANLQFFDGSQLNGRVDILGEIVIIEQEIDTHQQDDDKPIDDLFILTDISEDPSTWENDEVKENVSEKMEDIRAQDLIDEKTQYYRKELGIVENEFDEVPNIFEESEVAVQVSEAYPEYFRPSYKVLRELREIFDRIEMAEIEEYEQAVALIEFKNILLEIAKKRNNQ